MRRPARVALALALLPALLLGQARADVAAGVKAYQAKDYARAVQEWRPDADAGNLVAQLGLGWLYYNGLGVSRDVSQAERYYRLAAEQNSMKAQNNLALIYLRSDRREQALPWLQRGAALGSAKAAFNLGILLLQGTVGTPRDPVQARIWFQRAADLGDASAQYYLGLLLEAGDGVAKDLPAALAWFERAAAGGEEAAKAAAERLKKQVPRSVTLPLPGSEPPVVASPAPVVPPAPAPAAQPPPPPPEGRTLWILTVGVDRYLNWGPAYGLTYAVKDARDLALFFSTQGGRTYQTVNSLTLLNEKATLQNIRSTMRAIETQADPQDALIVFFSGHGTLDPDGNYLILPYDSEPLDATRTAVTEQELTAFFGRTRARTLLLLDTCHAGKAVSGASAEGAKAEGTSLIQTRAVGVIGPKLESALTSSGLPKAILAATTSNQLAQERAVWDNGVFTKALLEALRGQFATPPANAVKLSDMVGYLEKRVSTLTDNAQTPTVRWTGQDWTLARP